MSTVIVLNADYSFLNVVTVERAFLYIAKGKVTIEKYAESFFNTAEQTFKRPRIVRFIKFIRQVFKKKIPWSKRNILVRDNYTCQYCGSVAGKMTVDHIMPKSRGGKNTFENTVCSCFSCNNRKDDRTPREAEMVLNCNPTQPTVSEFTRKLAGSYASDNIFKELGFE